MSVKFDILTNVARLRYTLEQMERLAGIHQLTEAEKYVLSAAALAAKADGSFSLHDLEAQDLIADMPVSTKFRTLRCLIEKGKLKRAGLGRKSDYIILA
ncbi:hypothetical protein RYZ18_13910 [Roseovarius sp. 10]|uniref:hypothetical protein n=1 Tax=Roseovarius sp. 10 TaxID=3080563 RepID=UPI002955929F|nr:hypothetical protein [Roseovarius sp. 10]MDV7202423.1 hypothetical protein [Roseovarius sp. 10]